MAELNRSVLRPHHEALPHIFKPVDAATFGWAEARLASERLLTAVAETSGRVVGLLEASLVDPPPELAEQMDKEGLLYPRRFVFVSNIVTSAKHQGVGTALLGFAEKWAADAGIKEIELCSWAFNEEAQAFFIARGFQPLFTQFSKSLTPAASAIR